MRILLTNHRLHERAGTELYIRDVALALLGRGHEPLVYSRHLGEVARELREATIPVLDNLARLHRAPEIIHGQHHLETMTALAHFPRVPAIYLCHGWLPDEEAPPRHPRIRRYLAVDTLVRQRLVDECGLDEAMIETHLNFVDLARFRARGPLPERPRRALVLSNQASDETYLPAVRSACERFDIELDVVGRASGRPSDSPENLLGQYDLVFAKGRAALEATSIGAAVVPCDLSGLGEMVSSENLAHFRSYNFGVRLLRSEVTVEALCEQIERYDAADAEAVSRRLRQEIGLAEAVDRLIDTYGKVLADLPVAEAGPAFEDESRAVAHYLRWGPLRAGDLFQMERDDLKIEIARTGAWARDLRGQLDDVVADRAKVLALLDTANGELERVRGLWAGANEELRGHRERVPALESELAARDRSLAEAGERENRSASERSELAARVDELQGQQERSAERSRRLEALCEQLSAKSEGAENELRNIHGSALWRLRRRLLAQRWLVRLYGWLAKRVRKGEPTPAPR